MAFNKRKTRRINAVSDKPKASTIAAETELKPAPLKNDSYFEELIIQTSLGKCHFKRMRYQGCPKANKGVFPKGGVLINMQRDEVIDMLHNILNENITPSTYCIFTGLITFIRWCDKKPRKVLFNQPTIDDYMSYLLAEMAANRLVSGSAAQQKAAIIFALKALGKHQLAQSLPLINSQDDLVPHPTINDKKYVRVGKQLMKGYLYYVKCLTRDVLPDICPHFDENYLATNGWTETQINSLRRNAKKRVNPPNGFWENILVKHAIMLTYMFTGINPSPLFNLTRKDVKPGFKKGVGDYYQLSSIKGRALYQSQSNEIGFTKRSKDFFEAWLRCSEQLLTRNGRALSDEDPVFPWISKFYNIKFYGGFNNNPQLDINKALVHYGFAHITSSIYRKTRADKLFRAIGDIATVAEANNSSNNTVAQKYLYGAEETHQKRLGAIFLVQYDMAKGKDKKMAIREHETKFIDPLSDFDYKARRKKELLETPSGNCQKNTQVAREKVQQMQGEYRKHTSIVDTCTDFWNCFGCAAHAIVVEVTEIHKLLSLRDSIFEKLAMNSINSHPGGRLKEVVVKVGDILLRLKNEHDKKYQEAEEMNKRKPHPLWNDEFALGDILGVYGWS